MKNGNVSLELSAKLPTVDDNVSLELSAKLPTVDGNVSLELSAKLPTVDGNWHHNGYKEKNIPQQRSPILRYEVYSQCGCRCV